MRKAALLTFVLFLLLLPTQMQGKAFDPYAVLQLNRSASPQQIEQQFRRLQ